MSYRLRNILIAVALAGLAALLVTFYVSNYKNSIQNEQKASPVLVAAKDIPVGTLGSDVVAKGFLSTREVALKAVVPGAISSPDQIRALVATQPVFAGEQVTVRRFGPLVQQGLKGQLTGTYRAMQLAGDANQVLSGSLQPGDRVDFVGVVTAQGGNGGGGLTFGRVFVRNVKVIETPSGGASKFGGSNNLIPIILAVTDAQSQKIALVYKKGDYWSLELRPGLKSADSPNSVETPGTLFKDGIRPGALSAVAAAVAGTP